MEHVMPLPVVFTPLERPAANAAVGAGRSMSDAERERSEELSDDDLQHVVGGLARVWPDADGRGMWNGSAWSAEG